MYYRHTYERRINFPLKIHWILFERAKGNLCSYYSWEFCSKLWFLAYFQPMNSHWCNIFFFFRILTGRLISSLSSKITFVQLRYFSKFKQHPRDNFRTPKYLVSYQLFSSWYRFALILTLSLFLRQYTLWEDFGIKYSSWGNNVC